MAEPAPQMRTLLYDLERTRIDPQVACPVLILRRKKEVAAMLIARFGGDVERLKEAYDRAHALILSRGGATSVGELRHYCAVEHDALYIIGLWESEELIRSRWSSDEFENTLVSVGFPSPKSAEITILRLHTIEPPL
jgi:hypothetical protein